MRLAKKPMMALGLGSLLLILLWLPEPRYELPSTLPTVFTWDRDALWQQVEERFAGARRRGCEQVAVEVDAGLEDLTERLNSLEGVPLAPHSQPFDGLDGLEVGLFETAALVAACPARSAELLALISRLRTRVKLASRGWEVGSPTARDRLYRLLYGSRLAAEEVLLQQPEGNEMPVLSLGTPEPSSTPGYDYQGIRVHSGDLLVSRGGAPTSALIARGNDYPGNFSHVALVHVDEESGQLTIIEALIEAGVVTTTPEKYLTDGKLRIMLLRPRADLPQLVADPSLPDRAAEHALAEALGRQIPYDFEMDYLQPDKQFCSEVASGAYRVQGIELWQNLTSISARGTASWLATLGVRNFETHGPSDLEYDPKLSWVAEWRHPETLFQDHVDNAILDALLEGAESGDELEYSRAMLPVARLLKGWSWLAQVVGQRGPIPQGMSATTALRTQWLAKRHGSIRQEMTELIEQFQAEQGYRPPYWRLVSLARRAKASLDSEAAG